MHGGWLRGHGQLLIRCNGPHFQSLAGACSGHRTGAAIAEVTVLSLVLLDEAMDGLHQVSATSVPTVTIGTSACPAIGVHFLSPFALPAVVDAGEAALHLAVQVADVLEHLLVAAAWLRVAGEGAVVGAVSRTLLLHQLVLALLCFRELGCYYNQAQVDHEEGTHLRDTNADLVYSH